MPRLGIGSCLVTLLALAGCGSGSPATPSPSPTPPPVRTVLLSRSFMVPGGTTFSETVDSVGAGTVDARLDWGSSAADLNLYVTDTNCPGIVQLLAGQCRVLAQAVGTAKPETAGFTNAATANYVFWARNLAGSSEAATLEVGLTR